MNIYDKPLAILIATSTNVVTKPVTIININI